MSCPACDKVLPGAHRRCDGVLHNLCFVPVSAVGEENLCGLMLVMGKYCITVFNYAPLCRTEWRLWRLLFKPSASLQNVFVFLHSHELQTDYTLKFVYESSSNSNTE